jgi:hypothetical protein
MKRAILCALTLCLMLASQAAQAAIGCTLSNPAQDLKYLFPEMSSYKEEVKEFTRLANGKDLYNDLGARVGGDLDPIYEAFETPFTVYTVFQGTEQVGLVHGVNVPGRGGVIQVFLSVDPKTGTIRQLFFQRLESGAARALRAAPFRKQFEGLTLPDFYKHDYYKTAAATQGADKVAAVKPPDGLDENGLVDYNAALRGVRKNLIILDVFVFNRQAEPFYARAQEELRKQGKKAQ